MSNSKFDYGDYLRIQDSRSPYNDRVGRVKSIAKGAIEYYTIVLSDGREVHTEGSLLRSSTRSAFEIPPHVSDQFPASEKTVVMTAPAILEWLEGEIEDVNAMKATRSDPIERAVFGSIARHLEGMATRFAEIVMRGLDGDETAARSAPKK